MKASKIETVATLVNEFALTDLRVLLFTLDLWNSPAPTVYIYTDTPSEKVIHTIPYSGKIITKIALDEYTALNRRDMETIPGIQYKTLFADFCAEKTNLMEWAIEASGKGVLFCDADICHLGPLPEIAEGVSLALSPHMIRKHDTDRFGIYNAGFLYMSDPAIAAVWRRFCGQSRFFEQACLEDLALRYSPHLFEVQTNYGWWRILQGDKPPSVLQKEWGIRRAEDDTDSGITVQGSPLLSIHTHWAEKNDAATVQFNKWVFSCLQKVPSKKTKQLLAFLAGVTQN